jgi:hypothetical protein
MAKRPKQQEQLPLDYGRTGGTMRYDEPIQSLANAASEFAAKVGRTHNPEQFANIRADESHYTSALAVRPEYVAEKPLTRAMRRSYDVLTKTVNEQYEHLTKPVEQGGLGITVQVTNENPYNHPRDMHNDVQNRKILRVLSTESTGGHSLWSNEQNDRFRAVHDMMGHLAIGRDFTRHGEEAAYESHAATMPKSAHRALAAETRAQNAYMVHDPNYDFPPNAAINVPAWMTKVGRLPRAKKTKQRPPAQPELPF